MFPLILVLLDEDAKEKILNTQGVNLTNVYKQLFHNEYKLYRGGVKANNIRRNEIRRRKDRKKENRIRKEKKKERTKG